MLLVLWPNVKHRPQVQMNYCIFILMSYRITEWVRLEGDHSDLIQPPCSDRVVLQHMAQECVRILLEYL